MDARSVEGRKYQLPPVKNRGILDGMLTLHSPNGQFGCLTFTMGLLVVCVGLVPSLLGLDIVWAGKVIV